MQEIVHGLERFYVSKKCDFSITPLEYLLDTILYYTGWATNAAKKNKL